MVVWELGVLILLVAFFAAYIDSTLGMGYGTSLIAILLIMGFSPLHAVPAILLSNVIAGLFAALMHHHVGNVNFNWGSRSLTVAIMLATCGLFGVIIATYLALTLPPESVSIYIGIVVALMGVLIVFGHKIRSSFSWLKIGVLGIVAAFNKGISGGGYGPLVVSGQILAGIDSKKAVGITALAEGITSIAAVSLYFVVNGIVGWELAPWLIVGSVCAVPFSAHTVKRIDAEKLAVYIGGATLLLGLFTIYSVVFG